MGFVREVLDEEGERLFKSYELNNPVTLAPLDIYRWYRDRERDIIYFGLGGQGILGGDVPEYYAVIWKGHLIVFESFHKGKFVDQVTEELHWYVTNIYVPNCLKEKEKQIIELVKQSIDETSQITLFGCKKIVVFEKVVSSVTVYDCGTYPWPWKRGRE